MNSNKIVTAFKENLEHRKILIEKEKNIGEQFQQITNYINDIKNIYLVVFKNLSAKKEAVCKINDIFNSRHSYWGYYGGGSEEEDGKKKEVMLYLNDGGFSIDRGEKYDENDKDRKIVTKHIHQYGDEKDFVRAVKRLIEHKDEIWAKIRMPIKKERFSKFIKVFSDNKLDLLFDYSEDYHYFKTNVDNKKIEYYDSADIREFVLKDFYMETNNPQMIRANTKQKGRSNDENINLSDMEKVEQIYDELVAFLDSVINKQEELKVNLEKCKEKMIEEFAKELIIAKMDKDAKEDKKQ